jgi:hypothetical protein
VTSDINYNEMIANQLRSLGSDTPSWTPITEADSFPAQWEATSDERNLQVWDCSRRAGKTSAVILRTVKRSSERPGWRTLIIHHTRELGKQQVYETGEPAGPGQNPGIRELLKSHGIPEAHHDLTALNVRLANGSFVQVVGCDDAKDVGKKLGFRWNDIIIIETQEFDDAILERLVDKTILPTLIDRGGSLTLEGTPADVEEGVWFKLKTDSSLKEDGYHHWTLLENPFIDRENIVKIYSKRGFTIDFANPLNNAIIVQREIFGLQVVDPAKLTYEYLTGRNDWPVAGPPLIDSPAWCYSIGVDVGGVDEENDEDAIVVWGWLKNDPEHNIFERESWKGRGDSEAFMARVVDSYHRWHPMMAACLDTGGAGANKMLPVLARHMDGLLFTPKPSSVETSQRLLNDDLRSGRMKINPLGELAKGFKLSLKDKHEPDIAAAARYAHHGAYHFLAKAKPQEPEMSLDQKIREMRWAERKREKRAMQDPWSQEGGWRE